MKIDIDALAQEIRRVDGRHEMGAGTLAEALMPFLAKHSAIELDRQGRGELVAYCGQGLKPIYPDELEKLRQSEPGTASLYDTLLYETPQPAEPVKEVSVLNGFSIEAALRESECYEGSDGFQISYDDLPRLNEIVRSKLAPTPPAAEKADMGNPISLMGQSVAADGRAQQDADKVNAMPSLAKLAALLQSIGWQPVSDVQHENLRDVLPTIRNMFRDAQPASADDARGAARYRKLRDTLGFNLDQDRGIGNFNVSQKTERGTAMYLYGDYLDDAIDAAMQQERP